ncbi:MAG: phosphoenolpyruvate--protein phosphotransferase [Nitrospirae bacterium]|nr:phosphoenolpyruvate--protein phosphotransferase [Nitrospirota bacterium]
MKILKGIATAPGIVRGTTCFYSNEIEDTLPHYTVDAQQIPKEINRVKEAFEHARQEMKQVLKTAETQLDKSAVEIFNMHLSILNDPSLLESISEFIKERKVNAEHAVNDIFEQYIKKYEIKSEHFRELIHDFVDTRNRLLHSFNIETGKFKCPVGIRGPVIVAAKRLTPSMVLSIPRKNVLAFVSEEGGFTSHATILARSHGVPIIFGIQVEKELDCGMEVIVDGSAGKVIIAPDRKTEEYYARKMQGREKKKDFCEVRKSLSSRTKSGKRIKLKLNISTPGEFSFAKELVHDGVGLLRTEFLFMERNRPPTEEEQYRMYKRILDENGDKPVVVRVLDIGSDKMPLYFKISGIMNLDLGLRGAMAVEKFPHIYLTQMKALLRANVSSNLCLLYPMVSDLNDLKTFRNVLSAAKRALKKEKVNIDAMKIKEGVMIETPAAAMMVETLLEKVDFVNIGSNDLLQYTLATSRGSTEVEERYHILHPALLKMIEMIAREGKKAGKEVCLCGEIASFEEFYPLLLKIGLKSFSVAASKFSDLKCELLHLQQLRDKKLITEFYKLESKEQIDEYFKRFI